MVRGHSRDILSSDIQIIAWPSSSCDLNRMEHLWIHPKNQIRAAAVPTCNERKFARPDEDLLEPDTLN